MRILSCLLVVLFAACTATQDLGDSPSEQNIGECRRSCNQLKFFDCNDAVQQAGCFQNCDNASISQIDLFTACVGADTCDPECSVHIQPATPLPPEGNCMTSCQAFASECAPERAGECPIACTDPELMDLAAYCLGGRVGCQLPAGCESTQVGVGPKPEPGTEECTQGCDRLGFFGCLSPVDAADCSDRCTTATQEDRDSLSSCAGAARCSGPDDACYRILNSTGASPDVATCLEACDRMQRFDCLDAFAHSDCRSFCPTADAAAITTFSSCTDGICRDNSCWVILSSS